MKEKSGMRVVVLILAAVAGAIILSLLISEEKIYTTDTSRSKRFKHKIENIRFINPARERPIRRSK